MKMNEWIEALDSFLKINRYDLLNNSGKTSHEMAIKKADIEFVKYRISQDQKFVSDFDKEMKNIKKKK
jgi:hypothetical protein